MKTKLVVYEVDIDNPPPLTGAHRDELERLAAMRDEDIDLSDIPLNADLPDAIPFRDRHLYRPVKKQVTVRLDADLLEWFKANRGGARGYQTAINAALRQFMADEVRKGA